MILIIMIILMIKGSNSTGLNKLSSNLKKGNFYAL